MLTVNRPLRRRPHGDDGSITVLIIGYTAIAMILIVVGVDVSKVFLAQRAVASAADTAALAAAQGVDSRAVYDGSGLRCGQPLPLDPDRAADLAANAVAAGDLGHSLASVAPPQTSVVGGTVTVQVSGEVAVPFGRVLGWLDPSHPGGLVTVAVTSHARSPVDGGDC